jgi:hypothetical protein
VVAEFLELKGGIPCHDTFSHLFRPLDPAALATRFGRCLDHLGSIGPGVVAIDGETLRRSFDTASKRSAPHIVTAFACERRMVLAQAAIKGREYAIPTARDVLQLIDLKGCRSLATPCTAAATPLRSSVSAAASGCSRSRPTALPRTPTWPPSSPIPRQPLPLHTTIGADHGRIETRRHHVRHAVDWLMPTRSESDEAPMPAQTSLSDANVSAPAGPGAFARSVLSQMR